VGEDGGESSDRPGTLTDGSGAWKAILDHDTTQDYAGPASLQASATARAVAATAAYVNFQFFLIKFIRYTETQTSRCSRDAR